MSNYLIHFSAGRQTRGFCRMINNWKQTSILLPALAFVVLSSQNSWGGSLNLNEIAIQIAQQHNANPPRMVDNFTISSSATSSGKNVIFNYTWAIRPDAPKSKIDQLITEWKAEMIPQVCQANAHSEAFNQGLYYSFIYSDRNKNKITEYIVSRDTCQALRR